MDKILTITISIAIGAILLGIATCFFTVRHTKHIKVVKIHSQLLNCLDALNNQAGFFDYKNRFAFVAGFTSIDHFRSVSATDLLENICFEHLDQFCACIEHAECNRIVLENYNRRYDILWENYIRRQVASRRRHKNQGGVDDKNPFPVSAHRYPDGIAVFKFKRLEKRLFKKSRLTDIKTDCFVTIKKTFDPHGIKVLSRAFARKTKGQSETFDLNQLKVVCSHCFDAIESKAAKDFLVRKERSLMNGSLRYDILRRDRFMCKACGASAADGAKLHIDHIIPVSRGGKTCPANLQSLCDRCNLGKSDKE